MKIFIDPGHGGHDSGAVNTNLNLKEANLNLDTAIRLNNILLKRGYETKMSRTSDVYVTLSERANMANIWGANYFISLHTNSNTNPNASGISTYIYKYGGTAEKLAIEVEHQLILQTGWKDLGIIARDLAVLRLTKMPAILTENGFISNPVQAKELSMPETRQKIAQGIADGVTQFIKTH